MCGIAGYVAKPAPLARGETILAGMADALHHRGPDASGTCLIRGREVAQIGLAHTRLSIVGLADGAQPMGLGEMGFGEDDALTISFNGEIFNFVELRAEMEARGRRFRTGSDTEVLLQLYDEMGLDCLEKLNGDFAFALWDARAQRLVLARDRMGVRPLYHTLHEGVFAFASEVKALFALPGFAPQPDPIALDQIFTLWAPIAPRTPFAGVSELPPGHCLVVDAQGMREHAYWQLNFPDQADAARDADPAHVAEEVVALLTDATRIRLRADVPVGAYLSGGFDSSLTSALAAREVPDLHTFSVTFDSPEHDESAEQQAMVAALGTRHKAVHCGDHEIAQAFAQMLAHTERPVIRTAPAPLFLLSKLVRDEGFKVVLTGEGADEVFAGYDIFKEAGLRRFCARQPGSSLRPHLFRRLYPYLPGLQKQSAEYLAAFFGAGADDLSDPLFSHGPRLRGTAAAKLFFSPELRAQIGDYDAREEMAATLPADFARWHPLHQAQYLETRFLLPGYILSSQGDRMAMAHGVEGRFPFLDHRVVEHAAAIPPGLKLKGLREKHILREAFGDLLPRDIAQRTKQPYRAPDSAAFAGPHAQELREAALSPEALAATGLFNPGPVAKLAAKVARGGVSGFRDNAAFIGILSTQTWHARFIGGEGMRNKAAA